ncbi:DUF2490 domain-containing protein [Methylotenera sp. L2L1]|uniref:DUF2490 domain-containing protein n=1 Tax=Methylotenera sp. L2L1 TaxID=1502770 RepID=UPI000566072F|nr:DUF2490 domain-containing protein [Methylotenera sp. L2L1]
MSTIFIFCNTHAYAESVEDGRVWLNILANGATGIDKLRWYMELQPRWREEGSRLDQTLLRPAIYYKLTEQSSLWAGYAYVVTDPSGKSAFDEHRVWQQYLYQFAPIDNVSIQSRTRLEQRFIENSDDTGHKLRQMFRVVTPSGVHFKLSWVFYDEYFINLNNTDYGAQKGFDQNRAFLGGNWALYPDTKLEIGYLNQYVKTKQADLVNHVLSTTLNFSF